MCRHPSCQPMEKLPVLCGVDDEPHGSASGRPLVFRSAAYQEVHLARAAAGGQHEGAAVGSAALLGVASPASLPRVQRPTAATRR